MEYFARKHVRNSAVCDAEVRKQMDAVEENLPAALNKVARDLGLESGKTVKLEHNHLGHYFRVSRKVCC
jgi:hypothetical protein